MHYFPVGGNQAETAAVLDVQVSKIKTEYMHLAAVDDHHFPAIAQQVVGGASHGNACRQKSHFQGSEILFAATGGIGNQGMDPKAPRHGVSPRSLNVSPGDTQNANLDALLCA